MIIAAAILLAFSLVYFALYVLIYTLAGVFVIVLFTVRGITALFSRKST